MKRRPGRQVIVTPTGSGQGMAALGAKTIDIAMISRDIEPAEKKKFPGADFRAYAVAKDAVAPVVSAEVYRGGVKALSLKDLADIYLGKKTHWKEFGGPDRAILVIDKEASRGTREVFMKAVLGNPKAKAPGARRVTGTNNEEQTAVAQSNAAIGLLSNLWTNDRVKALGVRAGSKVIPASKKNILSGVYPLARSLSLVTRGPAKGLSKDFIAFLLSPDGQRIAEEVGFVAIRPVK